MNRSRTTSSANRTGTANPIGERIAGILLTLAVVIGGLALSPTVRESAAAFDRMQRTKVAQAPDSQAVVEYAAETPNPSREISSTEMRASRALPSRSLVHQLVLNIWRQIEQHLNLMRHSVLA